MNLVVIGKNIDDIAMDIWKANTNYTILNKNPDIFSNDFKKFIKGRPTIAVIDREQIENKAINDVIELFLKLEFIPIFIAEDKTTIDHTMYTTLDEFIPSALLWVKNEKKESYAKLIEIAGGYLLGKGIIINDNQTLRTSRKRKKPTSRT